MIIELLIILLLPAGILQLMKRVPFLSNVGAVALCYFSGLIISLLPVSYDKGLSQMIASIIVAVAIPLILFSFDIRSIRSLAKDMITGYGLQIAAAVISASVAALIACRSGMAHASRLAGMAIGLYTGGTPNLIAIGSALIPGGESAEVITAANTADFIVGGIYFFMILTVLRPVYRRFLGDRKQAAEAVCETIEELEVTAGYEYDYRSIPKDRRSLLRLAAVILLAILCLAAGAALEMLINGNLDGSLYIMITVSVLGIAFSFVRPVRETKGIYQIGQYFVLVFSLGLSMSIDIGVLVGTIMQTLVFFASVQTGCVLIHFILCRLFGIDGGTAMITNTAGLYGPPFIAPVAEAYGDRQLIAPGIICGVTGLVIGNLLGIGIGGLLSLIPGL